MSETLGATSTGSPNPGGKTRAKCYIIPWGLRRGGLPSALALRKPSIFEDDDMYYEYDRVRLEANRDCTYDSIHEGYIEKKVFKQRETLESSAISHSDQLRHPAHDDEQHQQRSPQNCQYVRVISTTAVAAAAAVRQSASSMLQYNNMHTIHFLLCFEPVRTKQKKRVKRKEYRTMYRPKLQARDKPNK